MDYNTPMFDTHCHLNSEVFENKVVSTIQNARVSGVESILVPGTDLHNSKIAIQIANDFSNVFAAVGFHPTEDLESMDFDETVFKLEELVKYNEDVQAVGEVGLDYYRYKSPPRIQKLFFIEQIKIAVKFNKALIIHNRHSSEDVVKILDKHFNSALKFKAVFHSIEADGQLLKFAENNGVFIGVAGDVTYDLVKESFIKNIPLDLIVLETDSPYQTPEPTRRIVRYPNEPKNLLDIAKKVAEIKNISLEKVIKTTNRNAVKLFAINNQ